MPARYHRSPASVDWSALDARAAAAIPALLEGAASDDLALAQAALAELLGDWLVYERAVTPASAAVVPFLLDLLDAAPGATRAVLEALALLDAAAERSAGPRAVACRDAVDLGTTAYARYLDAGGGAVSDASARLLTQSRAGRALAAPVVRARAAGARDAFERAGWLFALGRTGPAREGDEAYLRGLLVAPGRALDRLAAAMALLAGDARRGSDDPLVEAMLTALVEEPDELACWEDPLWFAGPAAAWFVPRLAHLPHETLAAHTPALLAALEACARGELAWIVAELCGPLVEAVFAPGHTTDAALRARALRVLAGCDALFDDDGRRADRLGALARRGLPTTREALRAAAERTG